MRVMALMVCLLIAGYAVHCASAFAQDSVSALQLEQKIAELESRLNQWREKPEQAILESLVADAERDFIVVETSADGTVRLKRHVAYDNLSPESKVRLHSVLRRAYMGLGRAAAAQAHAEELAKLGGGIALRSVDEIRDVCAQGRYAEAMYYIEQWNAFLSPKLIVDVNKPEDVSEVANQMRKLAKRRDPESLEILQNQMKLRRCLAQIYVAENDNESAIAQFKLMLAANPRYRVSEDNTLPITRKVQEVFEAALPKSNPTVPLLAALGGIGILIGSQSGGTAVGEPVTFDVVVTEVTEVPPNQQIEDLAVRKYELAVTYRDTLGRVAATEGDRYVTKGTITIGNPGANYIIRAEEKEGDFDPPVLETSDSSFVLEYTARNGKAVVVIEVRIPALLGGSDEDLGDIELPKVSTQFPITVVSRPKLAPQQDTKQTSILLSHSARPPSSSQSRSRWSDSLLLTFRQNIHRSVIAFSPKGQQSAVFPACSAAGLRTVLLPSRANACRFRIVSDSSGPVTLVWRIPESLRRYSIVLTDWTAQKRVFLHKETQYVFVLQQGEHREFEVVLEPRAASRLLITGLQSVSSRSNGSITIATTLNREAHLRISVQDMQGRTLYMTSRNATRGTNSFVVVSPELRAAPPGTYLLTVEAQDEDGAVTRRSTPLILTR